MSQTAIADFLRNKKLLLLGFGREGRSTYAWLRRHLPNQQLTIADQNEITLDDPAATCVCGHDYLGCINDFDVVLKSPGISVRDIAIAPSTLVTCQTDLFLRYADCETTIGITGTKGKTTTSSILYEILKAAGEKTCLVGNIGVPVFDILEDTPGLTAVIEMSSHQLEFCRTSPDIAVVTNLYEEHLDHYNGFAGYVAAKLNIARYQTADGLLLYNGDQTVDGIADFTAFPGRRQAVTLRQSDSFYQTLFRCNPRLPGEHNRYDILFAAFAARAAGADNNAILAGVSNYRGTPHRLEPLGTFRGIKWYDDAIATIPRAVECAVDALGDVDTLLIGGMDRGLDYTAFTDYLAGCYVPNLVCLPETGHAIGNALIRQSCGKHVFLAEDMEQAVQMANQITRPGKSCLLSPAASSYNVYRNFEEKGNDFQRHVRALAQPQA